MEDTIDEAREVALRHLERRRRTRREVERRLREKRFSRDIIEGTLERLERVGLIDDLEYARAFLRDRMSRRAVGLQVIRHQLMERGVSKDAVDQAIEEMAGTEPVVSEADRCRKALDKLLPRYANLDPDERRRRLTAALSRRGFAYELIRQLLADTETG